jgi:cellulose synthase/poly-beta-1,6-N-acetylglucosamine synthase-like glycosyltransferase
MSDVMTFREFIGWACLVYLLGINLVYLILNIVSFAVLRRHQQRQTLGPLSTRFSNLELPVSLLIPAYNEESTVAATVRSLLQLNYSHFEIVVINDGSTDRTLDVLKESFGLRLFPEVVRRRLPTEAIRGVYRSSTYPELKVIDKHNGGKADALNAGINAAQYPLFCALDADGVLRPDSLQHITRPFLDDPSTVAAGGIIRIANGCEVVNGWLVRTGLPRRPLALLQVVEYCRAFLFGRLGWNPVNGLLVISGAFGVFHKETVIEAGGYRRNTIGEDMELVVRLHRTLSQERRKYRIVFAPQPVCWTEAPENVATLRSQRIRWQRGLCESLWLNRGLLCSRHGGAAGWLAFPFALLFERLLCGVRRLEFCPGLHRREHRVRNPALGQLVAARRDLVPHLPPPEADLCPAWCGCSREPGISADVHVLAPRRHRAMAHWRQSAVGRDDAKGRVEQPHRL